MEQHDSQAPRPRRRLRRALVATAGAAVIGLAGLGVASAQTSSATTAPAGAAPAPAPGPMERHGHPGGPRGPKGGGPFFGGFGAFGGPGIHSESTFKNPAGEGYRTVASQMGEVTTVSDSSIEVKSEDGYSRAYKVDEGTLVNAGRDGIADVKKGDKVHVVAWVTDGTATAKRIADLTNLERFGQQWGRKPR